MLNVETGHVWFLRLKAVVGISKFMSFPTTAISNYPILVFPADSTGLEGIYTGLANASNICKGHCTSKRYSEKTYAHSARTSLYV